MAKGPRLGLASTEDLFREIISRLVVNDIYSTMTARGQIDRALVLAEMLGGLNTQEREYRTVDNA